MWILLSAMALAGQCPSVTVKQEASAFDPSRVDETPKGWFDALDDPKALPGQRASSKQMYDATEHMMVATAGKETRFYPVNGIAWHHIVNDVIDGVPIAVTY